MSKITIGHLLERRKEVVIVEDDKEYKSVTIRINYKGVNLREIKKGKLIGTKRQFKVHEGQFILSRIDARQGAFGIIPKELEGAIVTNDFWAFDINHELLDINYFHILLKSKTFLEACIKASKGTTNRKRIQESFFLNYELEIPKKDYQKDVVKRISDFEKEYKIILENILEQQNLNQQLRRAILQEAVQGKLIRQDSNDDDASKLLERIKEERGKIIKAEKLKREILPIPISKDEIPYTLPPKWVWYRFTQVAYIASNLVNPSDFQEFPHIAPDNIEKNRGKLLSHRTIREDEVTSSKHRFFPGQIVYSKIRPNLNKLAIVDFEGLCSADMYPITPFIDRKYLFYFMLSDIFLNQSTKDDTRIAMPKINQDKLSKILIATPPFNEQKRIVKKVDKLMKLCDELEEKVKESQKNVELLMQAVLQEAFNN